MSEGRTVEEAWEKYWQGLLAQSEVLRLYRDTHAMRGLRFADFRTALHDAFTAGATAPVAATEKPL